MKNILFITSICFVSCMSKRGDEGKPVFDKRSLRAWVLSTYIMSEVAATKNLDSILKSAATDSMVFHQTISYLETPFSNSNSFYRNQNLYSKLLAAEINSKWYNGYQKKIADDKLKLLEQNNVGNPANDFTYITPAGYKKRMYDIKEKFLLLYFNNPECNACIQMKEALSASAIINQKLKAGELKILSIYTDKDEKRWLGALNEYPDSWLQGRDEDEYLYKNKVYDLKAIPTIYLLDKDKKVVLKDCVDVGLIEGILSESL